MSEEKDTNSTYERIQPQFRLEDLESPASNSPEKEIIRNQVLTLREDLLVLEHSFHANLAKDDELASLKHRLTRLETSIQQVAEAIATRQASCCTVQCRLF